MYARFLVSVVAMAFALLAEPAWDQARSVKPKVPPGLDPGGVAVVLLGVGLDYTDAALAPRLARDGEGDLMGWDFVDGDNRPYAAPGAQADHDGTRLAKLVLSAYPGARLVPVRLESSDPARLAQAMRFVLHTPARIVAVVLPEGSGAAPDIMKQAASQIGDILFVRAAEHAEGPQPDNVLRVAALPTGSEKTSPQTGSSADVWITTQGSAVGPADAVALAAGLAACILRDRQVQSSAGARATLLAQAKPSPDNPARRVLVAQCG
jgi:hypothetical protein